jgi:hypothetical protein
MVESRRGARKIPKSNLERAQPAGPRSSSRAPSPELLRPRASKPACPLPTPSSPLAYRRLSMDPFKLLTVGASFSRSKKAAAKKGGSAAPTARRGQDVEALFHKSVRVQLDESGSEEEGASEASDDDTAAGEPSGSVLPKELDFFGVGGGGGGAKAEGASKKRKRKTTTGASGPHGSRSSTEALWPPDLLQTADLYGLVQSLPGRSLRRTGCRSPARQHRRRLPRSTSLSPFTRRRHMSSRTFGRWASPRCRRSVGARPPL